MTFDADIVSSYPSCTVVANVSRETTKREVKSIQGKEKEEFKLQNINLFLGDVNHVEYCENMFNFPSLYELENIVNEMKEKS